MYYEFSILLLYLWIMAKMNESWMNDGKGRKRSPRFCSTLIPIIPLSRFSLVFSQGRSWQVGGGGVLGCPWHPLGRPSFEQTTYNIQVAKTPWQYLGRKSHCWKAHFFKICFFVEYFRQRLLSLVNMGLHAAIIRLSPLTHEGEQRYKPYIVGDPQMVTPPLKNSGYAPASSCVFPTEPWESLWSRQLWKNLKGLSPNRSILWLWKSQEYSYHIKTTVYLQQLKGCKVLN